MLSIRQSHTGEEEALARVFTRSVHVLGAAAYTAAELLAWAPEPPDSAFWQKRFLTLHTIVADSEYAIAGFLSFTVDGHIDLLFTAPEEARKGVASRLLSIAAAILARAGTQRMFTEASLVARPFFARHGFVVVVAESVALRGSRLSCFRMEKEMEESASI